MDKWDKRFIDLAFHISQWSKDPSTQCAAVIVDDDNRIISVGYNGFPKGTNDDIKLYENREEKYRRVQHAERNSILFAKRDLKDCTMYIVPMPPCSQCAGSIIQCGIKRVVTILPTYDQIERWGKDFETTKTMFKESGIFIDYYNIKEIKKMNNELFNKILNNRIEKIRNVLEKKATEYSSSENRLHNFDIAAQVNNTSPEQALWGMSTKHLVSIIDMIEDGSNLTTEMIDEKIGDMINYLILLEAVLLRNIFIKEK